MELDPDAVYRDDIPRAKHSAADGNVVDLDRRGEGCDFKHPGGTTENECDMLAVDSGSSKANVAVGGPADSSRMQELEPLPGARHFERDSRIE
jgi:hypothetical protein